jgi:tetratricopeptide (TPR) repeat protein
MGRDRESTPEYQSLQAMTQLHLGQLSLSKGWHDEAETALKEAARNYAFLVREPDATPENWQSFGRAQAILGRVYNLSSRPDKAKEPQEKALQIFEKLAGEHPDVPEFAYDLGRCQLELALYADTRGRFEDAISRYDHAIKALSEARDKGYLAARTAIVSGRIERAGARAARGDHMRATEELEIIHQQENPLSAIHLYNLACVYCRSMAAVARDT